MPSLTRIPYLLCLLLLTLFGLRLKVTGGILGPLRLRAQRMYAASGTRSAFGKSSL